MLKLIRKVCLTSSSLNPNPNNAWDNFFDLSFELQAEPIETWVLYLLSNIAIITSDLTSKNRILTILSTVFSKLTLNLTPKSVKQFTKLTLQSL